LNAKLWQDCVFKQSWAQYEGSSIIWKGEPFKSCFGLTKLPRISQLAFAGAVGAAVADVEPEAHIVAVYSTKGVVVALVEEEEEEEEEEEVVLILEEELTTDEVRLLVDFTDEEVEDGTAMGGEDVELFRLVLSVEELEDVAGFRLELELVIFELVLDVFELGVPTMTVPYLKVRTAPTTEFDNTYAAKACGFNCRSEWNCSGRNSGSKRSCPLRANYGVICAT
jgi:hypothetical protein